MKNIFIVKDGADYGVQVWAGRKVFGDGLYPRLVLDENSDTFYASTSFSYFWTDSPRPSWKRNEVAEITTNFAVKAIVNHGDREECMFARYFEQQPRFGRPWQGLMMWLENNMTFRSIYNPYLAGGSDDANLRGWLAAWEWEVNGVPVQLRVLTNGELEKHLPGMPYQERKKIYEERRREYVKAYSDWLAKSK